MQKYIENVRDEIKLYCEKMFIGSKELQALEMLRSSNFNEDLLQEHESKLEDMKFKFEENEALYDKCGKWIEMWSQYVAFEEMTKNPERLKQRGYNMLIEEKQRKTFNTALPKLEEDIQRLAAVYKEMNGGQLFKVFNDLYEEFIYKTKLDHEESKKNQRVEKQILRATVNKNETRYGSKPITPLALRNKRKQQATMLLTPGSSRSQMQRTDSTMSSQATPGSSRLYTQKTATIKTSYQIKSIAGQLKRKSKTPKTSLKRLSGKGPINMNKRKSKTPNRQSSKAAKQAVASYQDTDATILSSESTATSTKTSSLLSTLYSNASSCSTNASSIINGSKLKTGNIAYTNASKTKGPPVCSSSKFAYNYNKNGLAGAIASSNQFGGMTSTASNTFIEEENIENLENYPSDSVLSGNKHQASLFHAVSAKLSNEFQLPMSIADTKLHTGETNYSEFSSQLSKNKVIRYGASSKESGEETKLANNEFVKPGILTNQNSKSSFPTTRSSKYK